MGIVKKAVALFLGILTTATVISGLHVAQGIFLDDWSGVHPYSRLSQLPLIVATGFVLGVFVLSIVRILKVGKMEKSHEAYFFGLVLGFVGAGSLLHPWVDFECTDWVVISVVFSLSLFVAIRFSLRH